MSFLKLRKNIIWFFRDLNAKEDEIFDKKQKILKLVTECKQKEGIICSLKKVNTKFVSKSYNITI
jgi:hypothetical protein